MSKTLYSNDITLEEAQELVRNGADVNEVDCNGVTPLLKAISNLRVDMVKFLIEKGTNVNYFSDQNLNPLIRAVYTDAYDIVKILMDNNADSYCDSFGRINYAIDYANYFGNPEIIKLLEDNTKTK